MGQKVHPTGFRLGISTEYSSRWYANSKDFSNYLLEDYRIRDYLKTELKNASVSKIVIERPTKEAIITIYTSRPGIVIGKKGEDIEKFRTKISLILKVEKSMVKVNVKEIKKPELDAQLVAEGITQQLERRIMYRRAMKRAVTNTMRLGALGIKVNVAGRLNGAEIARSEWYREGRVPLHTLDAAIDYGFAEALTTYGIIGVKVWIYAEDEIHEDANKKTKFRKQQKGRLRGFATSGAKVSFGEFGLKATTRGRVTARQIEAARRAMTRYIKRGGKIWIRIFPDVPITKKPIEVRMGKGKGNVEYWVSKVQPGKVLYEMEGVTEEIAREAFRLAAAKLPVLTTFVSRTAL